MRYRVTMTFSSDRPTETFTYIDEAKARRTYASMTRGAKNLADFATCTLVDEDGNYLARTAVQR